MKRICAILALMLGASASAQSMEDIESEFAKLSGKGTWHAEVEETERGYLIGNPNAKMQLTAFATYSCPECAAFELEGGPAMDLALLAPGHLSYEVRLGVDSTLDLTIALLTTCGDPAKFKVNHAMFLRSQKQWLTRYQQTPASQRRLWEGTSINARTSLANAMGFVDAMARRRGYSRVDINRCLTDRKAATRLAANASADREDFALPASDPARLHLALNGDHLEGVHSWKSLYPEIEKRYSAQIEADADNN